MSSFFKPPLAASDATRYRSLRFCIISHRTFTAIRHTDNIQGRSPKGNLHVCLDSQRLLAALPGADFDDVLDVDDAAEILKRAHETGSPTVLTQNGYTAAVLLPPELYDELVALANKAHKPEVAAAIERGRKAASQGEVRDHDSVMDELDQWLRE